MQRLEVKSSGYQLGRSESFFLVHAAIRLLKIVMAFVPAVKMYTSVSNVVISIMKSLMRSSAMSVVHHATGKLILDFKQCQEQHVTE